MPYCGLKSELKGQRPKIPKDRSPCQVWVTMIIGRRRGGGWGGRGDPVSLQWLRSRQSEGGLSFRPGFRVKMTRGGGGSPAVYHNEG